MHKGRLEAFSDGVIAVIITIMVLEMKTPPGADLAALASMLPVFLTYALSYTNVAIFWNNHHHMLQASRRVDGRALWANMFLLFWLALIPFVIRWMEETNFAALPTAAYGFILTMAAIGYFLLERMLIRCDGLDSTLARAVGEERKAKLSISLYIAAMGLAFVEPWIAIMLYIVVAVIWFVPDRRIEKII
ncbi:MAG TPA: TMEM175 family protein [Methylocella sp.]|nr:TMEM175 family protein [Methylocella sp.]